MRFQWNDAPRNRGVIKYCDIEGIGRLTAKQVRPAAFVGMINDLSGLPIQGTMEEIQQELEKAALEELERMKNEPTEASNYRALRCRCGAFSCENWHVSGVANVPGVSFTQAQAEAVAKLLNNQHS